MQTLYDLEDKTRFLAILATLLGCQGIDEFRAMIPAALRFGVTPVEVKETVYQAVAYLGIGRVFPFLKADSALVYRSSDGLFIITGCSHSGICNIVEYAKKICKEDRISGIIGGFHLFEANNQLEKTVNYLNSCNIQHLYPCHCVSLEAKCKMSEKLPLTKVGVGLQISM